MALSSISLLPLNPINGTLRYLNPLQLHSKSFSVTCQFETQNTKHDSVVAGNLEPIKWRKLVSTSLAAAVIAFSTANLPAMADLNKFEAETRGEFGIGSAAQFGSADLKLESGVFFIFTTYERW